MLLEAAVESLPPDEAKRHLQRCEESRASSIQHVSKF